MEGGFKVQDQTEHMASGTGGGFTPATPAVTLDTPPTPAPKAKGKATEEPKEE